MNKITPTQAQALEKMQKGTIEYTSSALGVGSRTMAALRRQGYVVSTNDKQPGVRLDPHHRLRFVRVK